jgi:hypothetical protein
MNLAAIPSIDALGPAGGSQAASAAWGGSRFGSAASTADIARFEAALSRASTGEPTGASPAGMPGSDALRALVKPLDQLDERAAGIAEKAGQFVSGAEMTPGDMIMMTVRCQEFMFQCQLTSNAANRTSDGLQQLFRQQG